jgi:hypothetical protein
MVLVAPEGSISSSVRPAYVCARCPGGGDNSIVCVGTQLCVPSKVIERKIHKIRKAEDKVRDGLGVSFFGLYPQLCEAEATPKPSASILLDGLSVSFFGLYPQSSALRDPNSQ